MDMVAAVAQDSLEIGQGFVLACMRAHSHPWRMKSRCSDEKMGDSVLVVAFGPIFSTRMMWHVVWHVHQRHEDAGPSKAYLRGYEPRMEAC